MAVAGTSRSSGGGIAVVDLTAREKKRAYNASVIFGARGSQSSSEAFSSKKFQASVTFDDAYHENVPILSSGTNNSDTLVAFYPRNTGPPGYGHRGHLPGGVQRRTRSRAALVQLLGEPQNLGLDVGDPVRLLQDDGAELPWA